MTMGWHRFLVIGLLSIGVSVVLEGRTEAQQNPTMPPTAAVPAVTVPAPQPGGAVAGQSVPVGRGDYVYLPEGRRDPFLAMLRDAAAGSAPAVNAEVNLPPLQRTTVAELTVIGIVWGGFGYMAMVQTPDGKGYAVQRGARIGNNNGIISAITEKAVIVEERFTDIYGKKQVREYAKPLHVKESLP
jgi:type IV pilus assembly protein PilP